MTRRAPVVVVEAGEAGARRRKIRLLAQVRELGVVGWAQVVALARAAGRVQASLEVVTPRQVAHMFAPSQEEVGEKGPVPAAGRVEPKLLAEEGALGPGEGRRLAGRRAQVQLLP